MSSTLPTWSRARRAWSVHSAAGAEGLSVVVICAPFGVIVAERPPRGGAA